MQFVWPAALQLPPSVSWSVGPQISARVAACKYMATAIPNSGLFIWKYMTIISHWTCRGQESHWAISEIWYSVALDSPWPLYKSTSQMIKHHDQFKLSGFPQISENVVATVTGTIYLCFRYSIFVYCVCMFVPLSCQVLLPFPFIHHLFSPYSVFPVWSFHQALDLKLRTSYPFHLPLEATATIKQIPRQGKMLMQQWQTIIHL